MREAPTIVDYATPADQPPRQIVLETDGASARIVFATMPAWLFKLNICTSFLVALAQTAVPIYFYWQMTSLFSRFGPSTTQMIEYKRGWLLSTAGAVALAAITLWPFAIYQFVMFRRWGPVPRILEANATTITLSYLGWRRMRTREWPTSDVTTIDLRPLKSIVPSRTAADLFIRFRNRRPVRFRLASKDATLPARIRDAIAAVTGMESSIPTR